MQGLQYPIMGLDVALNRNLYYKTITSKTPEEFMYHYQNSFKPASTLLSKVGATFSPTKWYGAADSYYRWLKGDYGIPTPANWWNNAHGIWSDKNNGTGSSRDITFDLMSSPIMPKVGKYVGKKAIYDFPTTGIEKRAIETAMRTAGDANGLENIVDGITDVVKDKSRLGSIADYILLGQKTGKKGYYNSFAHQYRNGVIDYYDGFDKVENRFKSSSPDVIDAYLYDKQIDPFYGLYETSKDYGPITPYIESHPLYKGARVYTTGKGLKNVNFRTGVTTRPYKDSIETGTGNSYDAAGHQLQYGYGDDGRLYTKHTDIWKFNPEDYSKSYKQIYNKQNPIQEWLMNWGLHRVDKAGRPIVVTTDWVRD